MKSVQTWSYIGAEAPNTSFETGVLFYLSKSYEEDDLMGPSINKTNTIFENLEHFKFGSLFWKTQIFKIKIKNQDCNANIEIHVQDSTWTSTRPNLKTKGKTHFKIQNRDPLPRSAHWELGANGVVGTGCWVAGAGWWVDGWMVGWMGG